MGKSKLVLAQEKRVSTQKAVDVANLKLQADPKNSKKQEAYQKATQAAREAHLEATNLEVADKKEKDLKLLANPPAKAKPLPFVKKKQDKSREAQLKQFNDEKKSRAKREFENQKNPNRWNISPKKAPKVLTDDEYAEQREQTNEEMEIFRKELSEEAGLAFNNEEFPNRYGIAPKKAPNHKDN